MMGTSMKKNIKILMLILSIISFFTTDFVRAQNKQKLAQTGMKFLSLSTDAKVAGMGNAITSIFGSSTSILYNPSAMADMENSYDISFGKTNWIADIGYMYSTFAYNPSNGEYGVFGLSIVAVDYGDFIGTVLSENEAGYDETGVFSPNAMVVGFSYAKMLSEKFGIGGNIKYVYQSLGSGPISEADDGTLVNSEEFSADVFAFDFGLIYRTGYKSLNIGMSIRNFSQEIRFIEEGFQLPLLFKLGMSMDIFDFTTMDKKMHSLIVSIDATHPRDYPEQILIGTEYTFMNAFSIRAGYISPSDIGGFSAGAGAKFSLSGLNMSVDYSWSNADVFDTIHRFAVNFAF